jgi:hypothetical protein
MHCGRDFSIKTLQHAWKETGEHTCWFLTKVSTFLYYQQKPKCRFFTQDTGANHTPKKNLYIGLIAVATVHMGKGIAHMTYVRTFSFRSALGHRKAAFGQVFLLVLLSPLSVFFYQRSILIFTYMFAYQNGKRAKRGNIQTKQTFLGITGGAEGRVLGKTVLPHWDESRMQAEPSPYPSSAVSMFCISATTSPSASFRRWNNTKSTQC